MRFTGVPSYELGVDMKGYGSIHHTAGETFDKVEAKNLATAPAVMALTAYTIAQAETPIAPHMDHAAINELLKDKDLGEFWDMSASGNKTFGDNLSPDLASLSRAGPNFH
jgi:hypothetical protein